jgi:hypothetical protein
MRFNRILFLLFSSCVLVRCLESVSRRVPRKSSLDRNAPQPQAAQISLDQQVLSKLESVLHSMEEKINKISLKLDKIESKMDRNSENVNLFTEKISDKAILAINNSVFVWEEKVNDLDNKISKLIINQNANKKFDESCEPLHLKLSENDCQPDIDAISQLKDSVEILGDKIEQNVFENNEKLEYLARSFESVFEELINKNKTQQLDKACMQIPRKERQAEENSGLINEILSMVKERLISEGEEDVKKISDSLGSMTDKFVSNFENMKSPAVSQKNKTTLASRKGGLIFPNVRNKPAKMNTSTFTSESYGTKDLKVSQLACHFKSYLKL